MFYVFLFYFLLLFCFWSISPFLSPWVWKKASYILLTWICPQKAISSYEIKCSSGWCCFFACFVYCSNQLNHVLDYVHNFHQRIIWFLSWYAWSSWEAYHLWVSKFISIRKVPKQSSSHVLFPLPLWRATLPFWNDTKLPPL